MDSECPGVAVRLDHLRLAGKVLLPIPYVTLAELRLEVGRELDPVGRVDVDHLHLAGEILAVSEAGHHLQRVAEDHTVGPVHVVAVELHGPGIVELRVREQFALHVLSCQHPQDRLGGDPLVHVQGDRIDREPGPLPLAAPLQPRLVAAQRLRQLGGLGRRQRASRRLPQQLGQDVGRYRVGRRAQHRWQMRAVVVADPLRVPDFPLRFEAGQRDVLSSRGILDR